VYFLLLRNVGWFFSLQLRASGFFKIFFLFTARVAQATSSLAHEIWAFKVFESSLDFFSRDRSLTWYEGRSFFLSIPFIIGELLGSYGLFFFMTSIHALLFFRSDSIDFPPFGG